MLFIGLPEIKLFPYFSICIFEFNPLKGQSHRMVKHTQTIRRQQPTNCLSDFDHFVNLALKELKYRYLHFFPCNFETPR